MTFNGHQVYGGPFYANATLISQDFSYQFIGTGPDKGRCRTALLRHDARQLEYGGVTVHIDCVLAGLGRARMEIVIVEQQGHGSTDLH